MSRKYLYIFFLVITLLFPIANLPMYCSARATEQKIASTKPKLVLFIVIDQFRNDYLSRFTHLFSKNGFQRLLRHGAYFSNANYSYATTHTACGHTVIGTGSIPAITGIIGNEWFERDLGSRVTSVTDNQYKGVPSGKGGAPTRLLVTTLGDQLKLSNNQRSKVIGISFKDRSAILPIGKSANAAYWFDGINGQMKTSTYYCDKLPTWVENFNTRKIPDSYFGKTWDRLLPESAYSLSDQDDPQYEQRFNNGENKFPHLLTGGESKPGPKFYEDFSKTPWANEMLVDFADTAIENEKLGQDEFTDFLSVSFSANDSLGHFFGPYSQEMQDITIRTDVTIARLLSLIDKRVGLTNTLIVLTSDHGAAPIPEYSINKRLVSGKINGSDVLEAIDKALTSRYGAGHWVTNVHLESVYLDLSTINSKKLNRAEVEQTAIDSLMCLPGIATCFTRTQLLNGQVPKNEISQRVTASYNPKRSGDIYIVPSPFVIFEDYGATSHGTPYNYDTHVPIILMGSGIKVGEYLLPCSPSDIVPTCSNIIGIESPNGSVGRILTEALSPITQK